MILKYGTRSSRTNFLLVVSAATTLLMTLRHCTRSSHAPISISCKCTGMVVKSNCRNCLRQAHNLRKAVLCNLCCCRESASAERRECNPKAKFVNPAVQRYAMFSILTHLDALIIPLIGFLGGNNQRTALEMALNQWRLSGRANPLPFKTPAGPDNP
jgi:hypothetical protein